MKKLFDIIKKFCLIIWSFIWGLFSKDKKQNERKDNGKRENIEKVKIKIIDNSGYSNNDTEKSPQNVIITESEVKKLIKEKYQENINNKEEFVPLEMENEILSQVKNDVQKEIIKTYEKLESRINEQVKEKIVKPTNTNDNYYLKRTPLKENFVVLFKDNTYGLVDKFDNLLSVKFKAPIVDYMDNYLKVYCDNKYYVYDFKGNILTKEGFKDIRLFEDFYAVINNDYLLDVREYNAPNFKLSHPIALDKMRYQSDYEIKKYISEYKIKIKSRNEVYHADTKGIIIESKPEEIKTDVDTINAPTMLNPFQEDTSINDINIIQNNKTHDIVNEVNEPILRVKPNDVAIDFENDLKKEVIENSAIKEETPIFESSNLVNNNTNNKEETLNEKEQSLREENTPEVIQLAVSIKKDMDIITSNSINEANKEELEDKNYEVLEEEVNQILDIITIKKKKIKNSLDLKKLDDLEVRALTLKNNLDSKKNNDIIKEKEYLETSIHTSDLYNLQSEIKNIHLRNKESLKEYSLQNIEDLNILGREEASKVEKELLKKELKKAGRIAKISNVLNLFPFVRNRYFKNFASGMMVKTHLKIYEDILKRKNTQYRESNFNNMINGHTALNGALSLTIRNINRLSALEEATKNKFPEMATDPEYIDSVNYLKNSLLSEEEKMLKKKSAINKYNLYNKARVRELKKVS